MLLGQQCDTCAVKIDDQIKTGMLRLFVCDGTRAGQLKAAAALIQRLPGVRRVSINSAAGHLDILFLEPAMGLLQAIHAVLLTVNTDMAASKVY